MISHYGLSARQNSLNLVTPSHIQSNAFFEINKTQLYPTLLAKVIGG